MTASPDPFRVKPDSSGLDRDTQTIALLNKRASVSAWMPMIRSWHDCVRRVNSLALALPGHCRARPCNPCHGVSSMTGPAYRHGSPIKPRMTPGRKARAALKVSRLKGAINFAPYFGCGPVSTRGLAVRRTGVFSETFSRLSRQTTNMPDRMITDEPMAT